VPSRPVMPIVNRPVPELKEGWLSASALKEPDFVSFAMVFAVYATGSYIGTIGSPAQAFRSSMSSCRRLRMAFFDFPPTGNLSRDEMVGRLDGPAGMDAHRLVSGEAPAA
jgi:hypothetical protein